MGKPFLKQPPAGLQFSISHSRDLTLLAVTAGTVVGIDVEYERPIPDAIDIADRYFRSEEAGALKELPRFQVANAFLSLWTQKEAYLKAVGCGLSGGLDSVRVSLNQSGQPTAAGSFQLKERWWRLCSFTPFPNYLGAIALQTDREHCLRLLDFSLL